MPRIKPYGEFATMVTLIYKCKKCGHTIGAAFDLLPICQSCGASGDDIAPSILDVGPRSGQQDRIISYQEVGRVDEETIRYKTNEEVNQAYYELLSDAFGGFVGLSDAAEIMGWQKQQVTEYRRRGKFPRAIAQISSGPIWGRRQIEDYRDYKDRNPDQFQ